MARQTPQQKRANAGFAKQIEKNMGKPQSAIKKKDLQKSPISTPMLVFLAFVVAGTLGIGFSEIGGALYQGLKDLLARVGVLSSSSSSSPLS